MDLDKMAMEHRALKKQVEELAARPVATAVDPTPRMDVLEEALKKTQARLEALEARTTAGSEDLK